MRDILRMVSYPTHSRDRYVVRLPICEGDVGPVINPTFSLPNNRPMERCLESPARQGLQRALRGLHARVSYAYVPGRASSGERRPTPLLFTIPRRLKGTEWRGKDSRRIQWVGVYPHGDVLERQSPSRVKPAASPQEYRDTLATSPLRHYHIKKIYQQILIHPDDRDFQRIVWKTNGTV